MIFFKTQQKANRIICLGLMLALKCTWASDVPKLQEVKEKPPITVAAGTATTVVAFRQFKVALAEGEPAGAWFQGRWCDPRGVLAWNSNNFGNLAPRAAKTFREQLVRSGYHVTGDPDELFSDNSDAKVDLEVGVLITNLVTTQCWKAAGSGIGGAYLKAKWQVYSPKAKQVVYQVITEGSSQNLDKDDVFRSPDRVIDALRMATVNLLAESGFHEIMTSAAKAPEKAAEGSAAQHLKLTRAKLPEGGLAGNIEALRGAVPTVVSGNQSGSGFFISADGYLITNQHVVQDARYVKIRLQDGREMVGEVLTAHPIRDIALVKTDAVQVTALAPRSNDPTVGEEVYLLGSPFGSDFKGSISKGILSGIRELGGLRFLQSDTSSLPGNSGGPLLDNSGAVIGIADIGGGKAGGNLNLFIPIAEVVDQLGIELK